MNSILDTQVSLSNTPVNEVSWAEQLPFRCSHLKVSRQTRPVGFRRSSFIFAIEAVFEGQAIDVCGESDREDEAMLKTISELIERTAFFKAKKTIPIVFNANFNSNGWASHLEPHLAERNACLELLERDAILSHWYTYTPLVEVQSESCPENILAWHQSELIQSEYPNLKVCISQIGLAQAVSVFLLDSDGYGVCGHSLKSTFLDSVESSIQEACRMAHNAVNGLYFKESKTPSNPAQHGVYYAYHEAFPNWLYGEKISWAEAENQFASSFQVALSLSQEFDVATKFFDPFYVSHARSDRCLPLKWGHQSADEILKELEHRKCPINWNGDLNLKPHPVP